MKGELILTIRVKCSDSISVHGHTKDIVMVPFTGTAEGDLFSGRVIGTGTDTQTITPDGGCILSARYMLEGTDISGTVCRIFVQNESTADGTLRPVIVTDSAALAELETAKLFSEVQVSGDDVIVRIYKDAL